jgi:hypothetical protein
MSTINHMDNDNHHTLDGNPADFPEREQAMEEYRLAWQGWLGSWGSSRQERWRRKTLESQMDELQLKISRGPGPIWKNFKASLPGYDEHWARMNPESLG